MTAVPWSPVELKGEALSPHSIQLHWLPGNGSSVDYGLESFEIYYNDIDYHQNVRLSVSPHVNSYVLEDLTPDTVYYIRVAAKSSDIDIEGQPIEPIQVQTLEYSEL